MALVNLGSFIPFQRTIGDIRKLLPFFQFSPEILVIWRSNLFTPSNGRIKLQTKYLNDSSPNILVYNILRRARRAGSNHIDLGPLASNLMEGYVKGESMQVGAYQTHAGRWEFIVWAPFQERITLVLVSPEQKRISLTRMEEGYWHGSVRISDISRYFLELDNTALRPDPASRSQPEGIYGPSELIPVPVYPWSDSQWQGIAIHDMIIYELHVGTFTPEGTFEAIIPRLEELADLGITAIQVMPVSQFPGERNWGYDGVFPYAPQNSYGGPYGFAKLVNACHNAGIAVILDVVYNHFGPEGCFLADFGPYYSEKYHTPWGKALNFDDEFSDEVRNFFFENARMWLEDFHLDGLRLDAIQTIFDMSSKPFLAELSDYVKALSNKIGIKKWLIAESDLNDIRVLMPVKMGGLGIDAQGCEDFHHSLHALLTDDKTAFYSDYGSITQMVQSFSNGFVYDWKFSRFRKRHYGSSSREIHPDQFIVFSQNHDLVGNRACGERLHSLVSFESAKLAAGSVLLSPYIPFLFMGEEYGEKAPFYYFISHTDKKLIKAVRNGRRKDQIASEPCSRFIDPYDVSTFRDTCLTWDARNLGDHAILLAWYSAVIALRKKNAAFRCTTKESYSVTGDERTGVIIVRRSSGKKRALCIMNFSKEIHEINDLCLDFPHHKLLDSADHQWSGPRDTSLDNHVPGKPLIISPESIAVYGTID